MNKSIKELKITSILMLVLCLSILIASQYFLHVHQDITYTDQQKEKRIDFIKSTQDIDKLREFSLLLLEADLEHANYINESIESARNIALPFAFLSALLVFYSYRLQKQFLTSHSNGTTKKQVAP
ncbi:MAG TPA: hypothetical protein VIQ81_06115 [Gammaproteobacteria bacterium]